MPYIKEKSRVAALVEPLDAGELNYALTKMLLHYADRQGHGYSIYNDILGALEGAKLEFYRRVVVPYEEGKRAVNGDVYPGPEGR